MNYVLDEKKNLSEFDISTPDYVPLTLAQVGDTCLTDGIEVLCIVAGAYKLFVDKNHDLSYYVVGSDMVGSSAYDHSPGTFGYEWGGYSTETGIQDTTIGAGLSNTNRLISRNLNSHDGKWWVVWDKVKEFRERYSSNWFVPSRGELNLIYKNRLNLSNITTAGTTNYWSSSESSSIYAWTQSFYSGDQNDFYKIEHHFRVRLCYYLDLTPSSVSP